MPEDGLYGVPGGAILVEPGLYSTSNFVESPIPGLYEVMGPLMVTALPDADPSPRIRIDLDGLPANARVTVFRFWDSSEGTVRGALNAFADGSFTIIDYEAPIGTPVSYRAAIYVDGEFVEYTNTATATLAENPSYAWVSDPLAPGRAVRVELRTDFAEKLTRRREVTKHRVGFRTIALSGPMGLLENVQLSSQVKTLEDAAKYQEVLDADVVLVRAPKLLRLPVLLYVSIETVNEIAQDVQYGGGWVVWDISADEVSPSPLNITIPVVTYGTYSAVFPTYADFNAAYSTYVDALRNPPGD
ncbi:hypothetical protein A4X17_11260 [Plantibacter sp. H53]|uniref:hypothetical protein n=1 Tax=Plantibacter sp. H53 TaxID=1827323 RepID=UPI0007D97BFE|nr:hypothetical protein [Plantibacter sp. H53]OAN35054.1 hypothetical protein A4X17_11260 [Plantibacter sp. H53]